MKSLIALILVLFSNDLLAADWEFVFENTRQKVFLQKGSEKIDHSKISVWFKIEYLIEKKFADKNVSSQIIKGEFFCNESKLTLQKFVLYDKNLSVVESWSETNNPEEVTPDSFGEILYNIACSKREISVVLALVFSKEKQIEYAAQKINPKFKNSPEKSNIVSAITQNIINRLLKLPYPRGFDIDKVLVEEVNIYLKEKSLK